MVFSKLLSSLSLSATPFLPYPPAVGSVWVGRDTRAAVDASSFLSEGSDAAAVEGYFIY